MGTARAALALAPDPRHSAMNQSQAAAALAGSYGATAPELQSTTARCCAGYCMLCQMTEAGVPHSVHACGLHLCRTRPTLLPAEAQICVVWWGTTYAAALPAVCGADGQVAWFVPLVTAAQQAASSRQCLQMRYNIRDILPASRVPFTLRPMLR